MHAKTITQSNDISHFKMQVYALECYGENIQLDFMYLFRVRYLGPCYAGISRKMNSRADRNAAFKERLVLYMHFISPNSSEI